MNYGLGGLARMALRRERRPGADTFWRGVSTGKKGRMARELKTTSFMTLSLKENKRQQNKRPGAAKHPGRCEYDLMRVFSSRKPGRGRTVDQVDLGGNATERRRHRASCAQCEEFKGMADHGKSDLRVDRTCSQLGPEAAMTTNLLK